MRSKIKFIKNGWYKTSEDRIYQLVPCQYANSGICGSMCRLGLKAVLKNSKSTRDIKELCMLGDIKRRLKFYCTDEEIMVHSL